MHLEQDRRRRNEEEGNRRMRETIAQLEHLINPHVTGSIYTGKRSKKRARSRSEKTWRDADTGAARLMERCERNGGRTERRPIRREEMFTL